MDGFESGIGDGGDIIAIADGDPTFLPRNVAGRIPGRDPIPSNAPAIDVKLYETPFPAMNICPYELNRSKY